MKLLKINKAFAVTLALITHISGFSYLSGAEESKVYDLVIYGPTSAGIASAIQAKRMDLDVIVVGPDTHLGGLTAGGLGWTDSGNKEVVGGIAREYYQRIKSWYDKECTWKWEKPEEYGRYRPTEDAQWTFEPYIAERVFEDWVKELEIPVHRNEWLNRDPGAGVKKSCGKITSITMLSGKTYHGRMFIDATYEGDLMAAAGVTYTTGREPNSMYDETLNGVQVANARSHQFMNDISAYVVPGDPDSGLLPRIHDGDPGQDGDGDHLLQAYTYRVCLTRVPENRIPFPKPDGYDPAIYELLLRDLQAGSWHIAGKFDMLPNLKTDTNNHGSFSTDNIGMNYDYPDASYERRQEILLEHELYEKGYFYFIANDPRVPKDKQEWMAAWGLAKDEFVDNGNWPHQIYVREARRMVSDFVMSENHVRGVLPTPMSVGMGSYNMDSHNVQRYVDKDGFARNEGDVQVSPGGPYPIDYRSIIPKKSECENLLVPVCLSSSHIAFGSIRMEPVFMVLGQSATTAAFWALKNQAPIQDVKYDWLQERLLKDGQVLEFARPARPARPSQGTATSSKNLEGIVVDDQKAELVGSWTQSSAILPYVDLGYRHDGNADHGSKSAIFSAKIPEAGDYEIRIAYSANANRASNVKIIIQDNYQKNEIKTLNQRKKPSLKDSFEPVGVFNFESGSVSSVTLSNEDADGYVIVDAVQWKLVD